MGGEVTIEKSIPGLIVVVHGCACGWPSEKELQIQTHTNKQKKGEMGKHVFQLTWELYSRKETMEGKGVSVNQLGM